MHSTLQKIICILEERGDAFLNFSYLFQQELVDWHRPQMASLVEAGVDMLAVETIPSLPEAEAILTLLEEFPTAKAYFTFSCKVFISLSIFD